jgi:hypothetical protein
MLPTLAIYKKEGKLRYSEDTNFKKFTKKNHENRQNKSNSSFQHQVKPQRMKRKRKHHQKAEDEEAIDAGVIAGNTIG